MGNVYVMQRFRDDLELVSLGTARGQRSLELDAAVLAAVDHLRKEPRFGDDRCTFSGFEVLAGATSKQRHGTMSVWTFHLNRVYAPAVHKVLYRIIGEDEDVEVGRLLHEDMFVPEHVPVEWLIEMVQGKAA